MNVTALFKNTPKHVQALVATLAALLGFTVWAIPQIIDVRDQLQHGRLEKVNILAGTELLGVTPNESCKVESVNAQLQVFDIGVLVKVRTDSGTRQQQFFPEAGIDRFLASRTTTFIPSFVTTAYADQKKAKPPACEESFVEQVSDSTAIMICEYPNECIEKYLMDLATGEILEMLTDHCY
jgi:hypothetical protein